MICVLVYVRSFFLSAACMLNVRELFEKLWRLAILFTTQGELVVDCQCIAYLLTLTEIAGTKYHWGQGLVLDVKIVAGCRGWCWVRRLALGVRDRVRCGRHYWMRLLVLGKGGGSMMCELPNGGME